jgi:hypothetical protein
MKIFVQSAVRVLSGLAILGLPLQPASAQSQVLTDQMVALRRGNTPEWSTFPREGNPQLQVVFEGQPNATEYTLSCRQEDVKQDWRILLNDQELARLYRDENSMVTYWPVAPQLLRAGRNVLKIVQADTIVDDIRIGEFRLHPLPRPAVLSQAALRITVADKSSGELIPSRLTITTAGQALQTMTAAGECIAIRPGFVYTANGQASIGLPAGTYTIYANRGTEYGVDSLQVELKAGETTERKLTIAREVATDGWISSDPHIHTFTYSRHGDASIAERAITIAGEGIELPVLTDHNIHVDIDSAAKALRVRRYFTPLVGNEVTTKVGHFNVFPLEPAATPANDRVSDWQALAASISGPVPENETPGKVVILNHARDVHHQFRPFGEDRHLAVAGLNLDDWVLPANAMEVINSGSQQNDRLRLFHDWLGMLNRGFFLTPIGSSDSHDVGRYLVGQARTYIRCPDGDPSAIDGDRAVESLLAGKVMVSFGLLTELKVNRNYGPGDLVPAAKEATVSVTVSGPAWIKADRVSLYANGKKVKEAPITDPGKAGVKWTGTWTVPVSGQDFHLVAIAEGPGDVAPFWPIARPYQSTSPDWQPGVMGISGAVWMDADGDGKRSSAYAYAGRVVAAAQGNIPLMLQKLAAYDEAVAVQAASILHRNGIDVQAPAFTRTLAKAPATVKRGFETYAQAWQLSQQARTR